jgi:hypothetical protein
MKVSIRDLLWLTVVAALGLGWWIDNRAHRADTQNLRRAIEAAGFGVDVEGEYYLVPMKGFGQPR